MIFVYLHRDYIHILFLLPCLCHEDEKNLAIWCQVSVIKNTFFPDLLLASAAAGGPLASIDISPRAKAAPMVSARRCQLGPQCPEMVIT